MPLYEYTCGHCGHRFEELQRMGEGAEGVTCPRCGEKEAHRELSTFASSTAGGKSAGGSGASAASCGGSGFT